MDELINIIKQKFPFIVIEGVIGVGKTTIATQLAENINAGLVLEKFEKNPYLEKFYKNPQKYALPVQTFFLNERFKQQLLLKKRILSGENIVADYGFFKNRIFALVNLKKFDYFLFNIDENKKRKKLISPDLIIYLTASEKTLLKHIQKRSRKYEKNISIEYLLKLDKAYHSCIENSETLNEKTKRTVLNVNMNNFDFENDKNLIYSIIEKIPELSPGMNEYYKE